MNGGNAVDAAQGDRQAVEQTQPPPKPPPPPVKHPLQYPGRQPIGLRRRQAGRQEMGAEERVVLGRQDSRINILLILNLRNIVTQNMFIVGGGCCEFKRL